MNDMERRKFEDAFKDAFQDAEISPGENVWTNVELDLARAEGGTMKRRVLFYQLLAAASVSFAMCVAGVGYYELKKGNDELTALQRNQAVLEARVNESAGTITKTDATALQKSGDGNDTEKDIVTASTEKSESVNQSNDLTTTTGELNTARLNSDVDAVQMSGKKNHDGSDEADQTTNTVYATDASSLDVTTPGAAPSSNEKEIVSVNRRLPPLYVYQQGNPIVAPQETNPQEPDAVALMLARLDDREQELAKGDQRKKAMSREKVWTSVGFSAGNFNALNPEVSSSATPALGIASTNKAATSQAKASGTAYSMGISFGTRITNRWVVQGGVNYMTQASDYTTTVAVSSTDLNYFKAASINEFREASGDTYVPTAPYSVNNSLRYISLPVQAGYLLVDRQFGVQMNAGVSTDMFLQNTIDPEGSALEKTTEGRGEDSPYRSVNFSGLVGSEITYRFAERYRLSLNPGIRYPFKSIYKDEVGVTSTPLTFDIGLRFRYIFK